MKQTSAPVATKGAAGSVAEISAVEPQQDTAARPRDDCEMKVKPIREGSVSKLSRLHQARQYQIASEPEAIQPVPTQTDPVAGSSAVSSPMPLPIIDSSLNHSSMTVSESVTLSEHEQALAVEATVAIVINGIHYAVLMASPSDLEYLGLGFLFSEGLISRAGELLDWEVSRVDATALARLKQVEAQLGQQPMQGEALADNEIYLINLQVTQRCHQRLQAQKRQLAGRTGCGMCGMTGLAQALPDLSAYVRPQPDSSSKQSLPPLSAPTLPALLQIRAQMQQAQQAHSITGAVHAAASMVNDQLILFEDVGRHNALDKLIGWQLRHRAELSLVVMTSRLSIELVQKSIRAQVQWLVGMSAPTSTAVALAQRHGLGVAGFLRDNRVTYYS